ncbi:MULTISPECIES: hypothetical protein [Rhodococcus erythropolis group]|uniref:hypothetical protein n=1 Tax=Rhodococcus erythropolis group TaxID=2840174 RepID=UPI00155DD47B|nr:MULTISPECIES: hypothetical protein [Rhodococcus erythropolis group]QXC46711.1 hypothetical protein KSE96_32000 [Rhodococcus qingshengii]
MTVVLMLGALVLLAGFVWTRTATEPAPKIAALAVQACGALLLSSAILLAACTYAYRRARQHSQSTD